MLLKRLLAVARWLFVITVALYLVDQIRQMDYSKKRFYCSLIEQLPELPGRYMA